MRIYAGLSAGMRLAGGDLDWLHVVLLYVLIFLLVSLGFLPGRVFLGHLTSRVPQALSTHILTMYHYSIPIDENVS